MSEHLCRGRQGDSFPPSFSRLLLGHVDIRRVERAYGPPVRHDLGSAKVEPLGTHQAELHVDY